ncbi:Bug family tripartite tricarboxylate transporter substrate binding protein [Variovorax sp. RA8]|uniref:Bug family tripartite tricarboxylate transporter substrate binding protein n=1 Tax=Variovorax sp. (strain JCM 16519 / RA8) TaxID=662548 RepID=UPI000AAC600F|nr:tripartite tricarboxylate transporter substrate binding protein [Variovorax sp. RA8]VTU38876.1 Argininosuccinate lyase [Variovorax sp. RA8]
MHKRSLFIRAALAGLLGLAGLSHAQTFQDKPITLVVGYSAGGSVDTFARALAKGLAQRLNQSVLVENKAGASEMVAAQFVAKSRPDGYTLLVSTEAPITQNQFLYKSLSYNPESDLTPVSIMIRVPMALALSPTFPAKSFSQFLKDVKSRKADSVKFASSGIGGITHLPVAMLATKEKFEWVHVPYKGFPPIAPDLIAGRVDATVTAVTTVLPYHNDGRLRIVAVGAESRIKGLPDVPTFKELGHEDLKAQYVIMLSAPGGLPKEVAQALAASVKAIVSEKDFQEKHMDPFALMPIGSTPEEALAYVVNDRPIQAKRIKISGASLE